MENSLNNFANYSDEKLIVSAQQGNKNALGVLVKHLLPFVYSIALKYLRDTSAAEDAAQEAFVKVWRNLKKYQAGKLVRPWVGEITKNTCLDILKQKHVLPFAAFTNPEGENALAETLASKDATPFELAARAHDNTRVQKALQKLHPVTKKVIALYYSEGLNFREISLRLNESLNTVKSRHRRALLLLRRFLSA